MDPIYKQYFVLNGVLLLVIVIYLLWRKPNALKRSVKFKLSHKKEIDSKIDDASVDEKLIAVQASLVSEEATAPEQATPINVIFTWNGHAWDAFEVLGIPAGSSMESVIKAYDDALKQVDPQSQEFIKRAYLSICEKLKQNAS